MKEFLVWLFASPTKRAMRLLVALLGGIMIFFALAWEEVRWRLFPAYMSMDWLDPTPRGFVALTESARLFLILAAVPVFLLIVYGVRMWLRGQD